MWCSGLPWIYGQLEEGRWGQCVMQLMQCSLSSMDLWLIGRGGRVQSVMKIIQCNGLPEIHVRLTGGSIA